MPMECLFGFSENTCQKLQTYSYRDIFSFTLLAYQRFIWVKSAS